MTDDEWLACGEPQAMLRAVAGRATDRKLRLFAAGCCRLVWDELPSDECRRAVELGERAADGLVALAELRAAYRGLNAQIARQHGVKARLAQATAQLLRPKFASGSASWVAQMARTGRHKQLLAGRQAELARDVFYPPGCSRPVLAATPGDTVALRSVAEVIYAGSAFDRLPLLADALESAGAGPAELIAHCRAPGPHIRGCWAIDVVIGRD